MYNGAHVQSIAEYFHNKKRSTSTDYSRSHTLALFLDLIVHSRGSTIVIIMPKIYVFRIICISQRFFYKYIDRSQNQLKLAL